MAAETAEERNRRVDVKLGHVVQMSVRLLFAVMAGFPHFGQLSLG